VIGRLSLSWNTFIPPDQGPKASNLGPLGYGALVLIGTCGHKTPTRGKSSTTQSIRIHMQRRRRTFLPSIATRNSVNSRMDEASDSHQFFLLLHFQGGHPSICASIRDRRYSGTINPTPQHVNTLVRFSFVDVAIYAQGADRGWGREQCGAPARGRTPIKANGECRFVL
jgi:hypothetical protein